MLVYKYKPKVYLLYLPSSTNCTIVASQSPTDTVSKMLTIGPNSYLPLWVLNQHHYCYYSTDSSVFLTTFSSRSHGNAAHMGKDRIYPWMGWQLIAAFNHFYPSRKADRWRHPSQSQTVLHSLELLSSCFDGRGPGERPWRHLCQTLKTLIPFMFYLFSTSVDKSTVALWTNSGIRVFSF